MRWKDEEEEKTNRVQGKRGETRIVYGIKYKGMHKRQEAHEITWRNELWVKTISTLKRIRIEKLKKVLGRMWNKNIR